ncbi:MAG: hypothetical protein HY317_06010 [Acidobacteria bacterium]|nr:hypothetical protein [Acidobacteriota bacterium]
MGDDGLDGPHLSGQMFVARLEFLRREHGAAAINRVLAALAPDDRERLKGLEREGWYPFGLLVRFDRTVARELRPGDPSIFERLGAASSVVRNEWLGEHTSLVNPHAFLSRVAEEHRRFHTFGRGEYRRTGFNEGELAFREYPEVDEIYCRGARGYLRAAVALLTGAAVVVEEQECQCRGDASCLFRIRWAARPERNGERADS